MEQLLPTVVEGGKGEELDGEGIWRDRGRGGILSQSSRHVTNPVGLERTVRVCVCVCVFSCSFSVCGYTCMCVLLYIGVHYVCVCVSHYGYNMHFLNCSHDLSPLFCFSSASCVQSTTCFKPDRVDKGEGGAV